MNDRKKRKSSNHEVLSGQLTARSHILNTNPEIVILEVCTTQSSEYIICKKTNFTLLNQPLVIGKHYNFSNLDLGALKIKSGTVRCFRFTDETLWSDYESTDPVYHPLSYGDFANIEGKVTKVVNDFGLLYIKSTPVIVSSCSLVAKLPMPKENQTIRIFNVHRIPDKNGQIVYAMCVKSYLRILDEESETSACSAFANKSPIFLLLGRDALRGFKFILWLQSCFNKVKQNINEDFLLDCGVLRPDLSKFYFTLVKNIASYLVKDSNIQKNSLLEEFITPDHNVCCGSLREDIVLGSLTNLFEIDKETPHLDEDEDVCGDKIYWQFDVSKDLKRPLIGVISVKSTSHRLTINDSLGSLYCLVVPKHGQSLALADVASISNKIVLVTDYNMIRERFTWTEREQLYSQKYKCLALPIDKVTVISSVTKSQKSSTGTEPHIDNERFVDQTAADEKYCISSSKDSTLKNYLSQHIIVQHKSSTSVPAQGMPARAYLLASVQGEMTPNASASHNNKSMSIFITLKGPMLAALSLISVNAAYEIRFPIGFDQDFFKKGTLLHWLQGLKNILPTLKCVTLPSCCEIYTVANNSILNTGMKYRDCYRVSECLENGSTKELISIVGYVIHRFHQDPQYDREKQNVKANGIGVPGSKIMAIILRDSPPSSQFGSPLTLYLSYWASLQYPLGLLPGSKVIFRFVTRVDGKEGSVYLRSSILTSFEVLELPSQENYDNYPNKCLWGPRSALGPILEESNQCQWMTVSMAQFHRVSLKATCLQCSHDYRNGCCSFAGCSASEAPQIFGQVVFLIEEFKSPSTFVFVPNSLMSKIFCGSEELLESMFKITKKFGLLTYYRYQSSQDMSQLPLEQKVFRHVCRSFLTTKRFHLLCRKFNKRSDVLVQNDVHVLYAVDIESVSLLMAAS